MRRLPLLLISVALLLTAWSATAGIPRTEAQKSIERIRAQEPLRSAIVGVLAVRADGDTIAALNIREKLVPASNMKRAIADILLEEGYIKAFQVIEDGKQGIIRISLKYGEGKAKVIHGLRRVSKPGLRIYASCEDMPRVMNGLGIAIVSTSKGVMTDKKARLANVGGEVLAFVW